jgi:hypothetical protein
VQPSWNTSHGELRFDNQLIKKFKQTAPDQRIVLDTIEELRWPERVDNPLSPEPGQNPKRRLHDTINNLNRGHKVAVLRFYGGGDGRSIVWRVLGGRSDWKA